MTTLHHEIKINASADKVWGVLTNLDEVAGYNKAVKSAKYISGNKTGVGAARQCEMEKGHIKERVTRLDERKSVSMELYESNWPLKFMRWTTEVTETDNGDTFMKQVTEYEPGMGVMGRIMNALVMKNKFNKILNELFIDMKLYVESKS
jgi:hypothetical protein